MKAAPVEEKPAPVVAVGKSWDELKSYSIFVIAVVLHFVVCELAKRSENGLSKSRRIYPQLLSDYADFINTLKCERRMSFPPPPLARQASSQLAPPDCGRFSKPSSISIHPHPRARLHAVVNANVIVLVAADKYMQLKKWNRIRLTEPYLLAGAAVGGWPSLWCAAGPGTPRSTDSCGS